MGQGVLWAVCQFVSIWEPSIFFFFFPPFLVLGGNGGLGTPLSSIAKRGAITADDDQERKREEVSPEPFFFAMSNLFAKYTLTLSCFCCGREDWRRRRYPSRQRLR